MKNYDLAIIGAGPAGLSAAATALSYTSKIVVLDDNKDPGGQLIKQTHRFFGSKEHGAGIRGFIIGQKLLETVAKKGCNVLLDTKVYSINKDENQYIIHSINGGSSQTIGAKAVVIATGASENSIAFPGWTLPGVITAGAAQTMININHVLPGKKVLMVGSGNVGLIVAYQMLQAGVEVVGVVEVLHRVGGYDVHANKLMRAGVPILTGHTIVEAKGNEQVELATIAKVDSNLRVISGTERTIDVDTICLAVGLSPLYQLAALAGAEIVNEPKKGGYIPLCDQYMCTSAPGLFVAGDLAAIEEASVAIEEGNLAGISAVEYLGLVKPSDIADNKNKSLENLAALRVEQCHELIGKSMDNETSTDVCSKELNRFKVVVDCTEEIPCNPCEFVCPTGAIQVGRPIYRTPQIYQEKCTGCCKCVAICPGLACFIIDYDYSPEMASIALPFEYLPIPQRDDKVFAVDEHGSFICTAEVLSVSKGKNDTKVVKLKVSKEVVHKVKGFTTVCGEGEDIG